MYQIHAVYEILYFQTIKANTCVYVSNFSYMFMCVYPWVYTCTKKHHTLWHLLISEMKITMKSSHR